MIFRAAAIGEGGGIVCVSVDAGGGEGGRLAKQFQVSLDLFWLTGICTVVDVAGWCGWTFLAIISGNGPCE